MHGVMGKPRVSVLGAGYLGVTHAACLASLGFDVWLSIQTRSESLLWRRAHSRSLSLGSANCCVMVWRGGGSSSGLPIGKLLILRKYTSYALGHLKAPIRNLLIYLSLMLAYRSLLHF